MIYQVESKPYKAILPRKKDYCHGCSFQSSAKLCISNEHPYCCKDGVHRYIFVRVIELSHNIRVV
jgi:hypothetical protein